MTTNIGRVKTVHSETCLTSCLEHSQIEGGSVVRFSPNGPNRSNEGVQQQLGEQLVVILRTPSGTHVADSSVELVHCALVSICSHTRFLRLISADNAFATGRLEPFTASETR